MKPARLALTHNLVVAYGLHKNMTMVEPRKATFEEIHDFHSADYIDFLQRWARWCGAVAVRGVNCAVRCGGHARCDVPHAGWAHPPPPRPLPLPGGMCAPTG
jgi:acetoin utilization deacetylase AcuC-like enzyme